MFSNWSPPTRKLGFCLALVGVTLAAYWPVHLNAFVNFDDPVYLTANPQVQPGLTGAGILWAFKTGYGANWHPLTWLSHMLDCQLYGLSPWGHHLTNLLFHVTNALLLFLLLQRMTGAPWRSAWVAALFAWHPLHVESVAWIAERKDVLSTCFGLLSLWAYVRYAQPKAQKPNPKAASRLKPHASGFYLLSLLLFALSLMSKPMLVTLPFLLLLLDYWPLQRLYVPACQQAVTPTLRVFLEKIPFLILAAASSIVTILVQARGSAIVPAEVLPLGQRVANAALAYLTYAGKMLWPTRLAVFYPYHRHLSPGALILAVIFLAGVTFAALRWRRRRPWFLVGWFWFLGSLVPVIGLVQVGAQALADRYTYLPLIGLFVLVAWLLAEVPGRWRGGRPVVLAAGAAVLLLCVGLTWRQVSYWKDSEALFRHALAVTTDNFLAHGNLGSALAETGRPREAQAEFATALSVHPRYYPATFALGNLARTNGSPDAALAWFNQALALRPDDAEVQYNHAVVLAELQKEEAAIDHYREALRLDPALFQAHNNLAELLLLQGKSDEGLAHALEALRLQSAFPQAHFNAGNALFLQEKFPEAEAHYRLALQLDPNMAKAHLHLAKALITQDKLPAAEVSLAAAARLDPKDPEPLQLLAKVHAAQKRPSQALQDYRAALRLEPDWVEGLNNQAWLLATHPEAKLRDGAQAVQLAARASVLTGGTNTTVQQTLAAAYAEAGMFQEALDTQQGACFLILGERGSVDWASNHRLESYRAGKPCREP